MNLNDRLNAVRAPLASGSPGAELAAANGTPPPTEPPYSAAPLVAAAAPVPAPHTDPHQTAVRPRPTRDPQAYFAPDGSDPLAPVKEKAAQELFVRIGARLNDSTLTEEKLHQLALSELGEIVGSEQLALTSTERNRLIDDISADVLGYGPLEPLLDDESVSEIMVNRFDQIYVERDGRLMRTGHRFTGEAQLRRVIDRIVSRVGRRIDESSPLVDARLEDGSRVNAIIPPLAVNGSSLTIRKFAGTPYTVNDLVGFGTLTPELAMVLDAAVKARLTILVSGGTGTGKTTLLNVLSGFVPSDERIVTIEDAVELQLQQDHVVRLESRPPNIEGRGEITIRDLVRNALRMRPDRIVIGEVRGAESLDMLQAMNTGHEGSISTVHANSPRDAISRLETLVLMAGMELPLRAIREQVASALDIIVQISRQKDGTRRVTHVTEVYGMEGEVVTLQDAFVFDHSAGFDAQGRMLGSTLPTGVRPRFAERIAEHGIELPLSVFQLRPGQGPRS